jgi:hypothetical protein
MQAVEKIEKLEIVMTISYAVDKQGRVLSEGMHPDVEKRLDTVMEEIDSVLPEFFEAADRAGLELVFMRDGEIDRIPHFQNPEWHPGRILPRDSG